MHVRNQSRTGIRGGRIGRLLSRQENDAKDPAPQAHSNMNGTLRGRRLARTPGISSGASADIANDRVTDKDSLSLGEKEQEEGLLPVAKLSIEGRGSSRGRVSTLLLGAPRVRPKAGENGLERPSGVHSFPSDIGPHKPFS